MLQSDVRQHGSLRCAKANQRVVLANQCQIQTSHSLSAAIKPIYFGDDEICCWNGAAIRRLRLVVGQWYEPVSSMGQSRHRCL